MTTWSRRALIALAAMAAGAVLAWFAIAWSLFAETTRETAHIVVVEGVCFGFDPEAEKPTPVQAAFFASRYGGLHGDGEDVTVYRLRPEHVQDLMGSVKVSASRYRWSEQPVLGSTIWRLRALLPGEFQPRSHDRMLYGRVDGPWIEEIFIDPIRSLVYVTKIVT